MKNWMIAFVCVLGLSGCLQTTVPNQTLPEITFQHLAPFSLDVAAIEVVDQSRSSLSGKHVEHLFPTSPKTALRNWVRDRLQANGETGVAKLIVHDVSAVEEKLEKKSGIKGFFTNDQSERYTVNLDTRLELLDGNGNLMGYTTAKSSRHTTIAEDASLLDREKAWFNLVETVMKEYDQTMVANMNRMLGRQ